MSSDYYRILGVNPSALAEEIKRLYKKLAVKFHPDKTSDSNHHERFLEISKAYETLKDVLLRQKYDLELGVHPSKLSTGHDPGFRSHHGYTYSPGKSSFASGTYFGYYQQNSLAYTEAYSRNNYDRSRAEQEDAASIAARLAQKKMQEDMERRRHEYLREAQRQREAAELQRRKQEEIRLRMEQQLRNQKEQLRREMEQSYVRVKKEAFRSEWQNIYEVSDDDSQPGDSNQPIIVEDDDDSQEFEDCQSPPHVEANDTLNELTLNEDHAPEPPQTPRGYEENNPDLVEVEDASVFSSAPSSPHKQPRESPTQNHQETAPRGTQPSPSQQKSQPSAKRTKLNVDMNDLRKSLGTSLDDVDFSDMLDTLPETGKTRKASSTVQSSAKRPKVEFSDGTTQAETLYTPVNKGFTSKNSLITASDLSPEVDESVLMFSCAPPTISVNLSLTEQQWGGYVQAIHKYERNFATFRKSVFAYQNGRLEKDERHHEIIYSDTSCLDAYQTVLFNDLLLLQSYSRALHEFRNTLKVFKTNCDLVESMKVG